MSKNNVSINDEYARLYPDRGDNTRARDIGEHCKIARLFWQALSKSEQKHYNEEAQTEFEAQLKEYHDLRQAIARNTVRTPESQER